MTTPTSSIESRVDALLTRMTLEEKCGLMFHGMMPVGQDGNIVEGMTPRGPFSTRALVHGKHLNHFNIGDVAEPRTLATWHNHLQELALGTRLGIPITISSDPRHASSHNIATNIAAGAFSMWPEPPGLAAMGDEAAVREFGDIARQEYLAVGIRVALHPMADLATEPRWGRINGTFGEDAHTSAKLTAAYIRGFQGDHLGPSSVACMTKHFPGGGPHKDGEDSHFARGRAMVYPGNNFEHHLIPFEAAFAAGTSQIMPYYGMPVGTELEEVGAGFNKQIITGLLRGKYKFDGIVCADWLLLNPVMAGDRELISAKCWGVEHLTVPQRALKVIDAGVDQFGGEVCPEVIVELVRSGQVTEQRIDVSARRLLREKFRLGLFDHPMLDVAAASSIVGKPEFLAAGQRAQRRSIVLLKNGTKEPVLPLKPGQKLYVENLSPGLAAKFAQIVARPEDADVAVLRIRAPFEPREGLLESFFHQGQLDFTAEALAPILKLLARVPTIVDIYLERPAVIPEISAQCAALLGSFGSDDAALLDVIFGVVHPTAGLPFELPSSMDAVRGQKSDVPFDSARPLYPYGHGLRYA